MSVASVKVAAIFLQRLQRTRLQDPESVNSENRNSRDSMSFDKTNRIFRTQQKDATNN
jgi:hypothetical protein